MRIASSVIFFYLKTC